MKQDCNTLIFSYLWFKVFILLSRPRLISLVIEKRYVAVQQPVEAEFREILESRPKWLVHVLKHQFCHFEHADLVFSPKDFSQLGVRTY